MKKTLPAFLSIWLISHAAAAVETLDGLRGQVTAESAPLARASVYAYELANLEVSKVESGSDGEFLFERLPAGVYKLIAFKAGFEPAVVLLSRAAAEAQQFVELRLQQDSPDVREGEDYWSLRQEIPPDVLRDIEAVRLAEWSRPVTGGPTRPFTAELQASTSLQRQGESQSQISGAEVGMETQIGAMQIDLDGQLWQLESRGSGPALGATQGEAATVALTMRGAGSGEGRVDMTSVNERYANRQLKTLDEADFERYQLQWDQPIGERSHSSFSAQYLEQNNYFQPDWAAPLIAPHATRSMNVAGSYSIDLSNRTSLETGIRYVEQNALSGLTPGAALDQRALEVFGRGGWRAQPRVLVEYGIYTQLQDGSMALAPQGNVVVQLGANWQTAASVSQRIEEGNPEPLFSAPVRFGATDGSCQGLDEHCYRLSLSRQAEDDNNLLSVGARHREVAETLQLHFNDDFFNQLESLYLVRGDELPEVQVVFQRQITPQVLARLESTYAEGGGGMLYATDKTSYENQVRYLVTSIDTRFQRSSTGVFLAFHHLEQALEAQADQRFADPTLDLDRLQLMLSQDLDVLLRAAGDLAVHLNLELSRGSMPYSLEDQDFDELRRRVSGGVSLRF